MQDPLIGLAPIATLRPRTFSHIASAERGRVSLRVIILIRWIAVTGQAIALLLVHHLLGFTLRLDIALGIVALTAVMNVVPSLYRSGPLRLSDRATLFSLAFDAIELGALLYLTGGLENPFALFLLAPVTIGATILLRSTAIGLVGLTLAIISGLALWHLPLPWHGIGPNLPQLYILAVWSSLTLATLFITAYTFSITEETRRMSDAFAATHLALAREQRISAVGALAAAVAHELGSPLGTIAVIAKEMVRDLPGDSPLTEDARLLLSESGRCRTILAELGQRREADGGAPYEKLPLHILVDMAGAPHQHPHIRRFTHLSGRPEHEPAVARSPEIIHGLGNLIQNATQFAKTRVEIAIGWTDEIVTIEIADDGPGFPAAVLSRLGEPYLSGREDESQHMGLGIFIAETLLARTGARLRFANAQSGSATIGARIGITWPRAALAPMTGVQPTDFETSRESPLR